MSKVHKTVLRVHPSSSELKHPRPRQVEVLLQLVTSFTRFLTLSC